METSKFMQITCKLDPSWINRKEIEVLGSAQGLRKVYCESQYAMRGGRMEALWGRCACSEIPEWGSKGQIIWNVPLGWGGLRWTSISEQVTDWHFEWSVYSPFPSLLAHPTYLGPCSVQL